MIDRLSAGLGWLDARHPWNHNDHFHSWVLANLPDPCRVAVDVGCGEGSLVAALAPHVGRVIGTDVDPGMREQASSRCARLPDVMISGDTWADDVDGGGGEDGVDLITMVAVLHHLDVAGALREVQRRLAPGGRFLAVGLARPVTLRDHAWDVASAVTNPVIGYVKHPWPSRVGRIPPPFPVRSATLSFEELRELVDQHLPGAVVRHRLGFRHTIAWTKPERDGRW